MIDLSPLKILCSSIQGRLNQWSHRARAGPQTFFLFKGRQLVVARANFYK